MPEMPPFLSWLIFEAAVILAFLAVFWAWNTQRLVRRYESLREDVEALLGQARGALSRLAGASRGLNNEIERLFSDPAAVHGLERLQLLRAGLGRQKEAVEEMMASPMTAAFLMREALPALDHAVAAYEKDLSTVLRQWDSVLGAEESPRLSRAASQAMSGGARPEPAKSRVAAPASAAGEEAAAQLASLRSEYAALKKMNSDLVAWRQAAQERIGELEGQVARIGASEGELAQEAQRAQASRFQPDASVARIKELEDQLHAAKANEMAFERLRENVARLEQQNAELQTVNELLLQETAAAEVNLAEDQKTREEVAALEEEIARLKEQLSQQRSSEGDREGTEKATEMELGRLKSALRAREAEVVSARQDTSAAKAELGKAQSRIEENAKKAQRAENELRQLRSFMEGIEKRSEEWKAKAQSLEQDAERLRARLKTASSGADAEADDSQGEMKLLIGELRMRAEISEATVTDMTMARDKALQDLQTANHQMAQLDTVIAKLEEEKSALEEQIKRMTRA